MRGPCLAAAAALRSPYLLQDGEIGRDNEECSSPDPPKAFNPLFLTFRPREILPLSLFTAISAERLEIHYHLAADVFLLKL